MKPLKRLLFIAVLGVVFLPLCLLQFLIAQVQIMVVFPVSWVLTGRLYDIKHALDFKLVTTPIEWLNNTLCEKK